MIPVVPVSLGCYPTISQAISVATDGSVSLPSDIQPSQITDAMLQPSSPDSTGSVVIGIDYNLSEWSGDSKVWSAGDPCTDTRSFGLAYIGDAWNDRPSSAHTYGGCDRWHHFEDRDYNGAQLVCKGPNSDEPCKHMGVLNDQTSSEKFKHA
jgi:hypothetical protein